MDDRRYAVASAETVVMRGGDRVRRERFCAAVSQCGYAEDVAGEQPPGSGYLVAMARSKCRPVSMVEWVNHGPAIMERFEALNHERLVDESRRGYVCAFVDFSRVFVSVAVRYGSRLEAELFARLQGETLLFNLATGQQEYV